MSFSFAPVAVTTRNGFAKLIDSRFDGTDCRFPTPSKSRASPASVPSRSLSRRRWPPVGPLGPSDPAEPHDLSSRRAAQDGFEEERLPEVAVPFLKPLVVANGRVEDQQTVSAATAAEW